jgi:hypothetical protein
MKKITITVWICLLSVIILVSCGPPPQVGADESKRCRPHDLSLVKTSNHFALIAWNPGCTGTRIMQGFNIYLSPTPLVEKYPGSDLPSTITPYNPEIYPGDTIGDPRRETYECKDIENAVVYYAHVRAVYNDNTLSEPTNEIEIVAYPQGEMSLSVSFSGADDGFSFVKNSSCRTDDLENDLYFYDMDGNDYLCSPSRLGPVNRKTEIYKGRPGQSLDDLIAASSATAPSEKIKFVPGDVFLLITDDGYPVRLEINEIAGKGNDRVARIEYLYRPPAKGADSGV